mgnify:CR=1 FL=1
MMLYGKQHLLLMHTPLVSPRYNRILRPRPTHTFASWLDKVEGPADSLLLMACENRWFGSSEVALAVVLLVLFGCSQIYVI